MQTKEVKHILGDGTEQDFIRLYADESKALTSDGESLWGCVDVPPDEVGNWREVDDPEWVDEDTITEATADDYEAALAEMGVQV